VSDVAYISQAALGATTAVQLKDIFSGVPSGNKFRIKNVSGTISLGTSNAVTATNGYPLAAAESVELEAQAVRKLWAIGGATDRLAVMVVS
jgi:hypothetical protein